MNKRIKIGIAGEKESAQEFVDVWKQAEQGNKFREPLERIYFLDLETMLRTLTTRRLELLHFLHRQGASSVRALSQQLKRDYKNVHADVKALKNAGLVEATADGRVYVPWDSISAEMDLAA